MDELRTTSIPNLLAGALDTPAVRRAQDERERTRMEQEIADHVVFGHKPQGFLGSASGGPLTLDQLLAFRDRL